MARRVYFAFHYADVFRVNVVRNSWRMHPNRESSGYFDASLWEKAKKESDLALKRLINGGLQNTSVTVFLLGADTANRKWVNYELVKSVEKGNGLLAVRIHNIKKPTWVQGIQMGLSGQPGPNILDEYQLRHGAATFHNSLYGANPLLGLASAPSLSRVFQTYDWINDDGYNNLGRWVEDAAQRATTAYGGKTLLTRSGMVPWS